MVMTTAPETQYCLAKIEHDGEHLWIDGNQKITAGNGDYENPMPNAFSLLQIEDCPFSTEICRSTCYVHNLEKFANPTHQRYRHNSQTIRKILETEESFMKWGGMMAYWVNKNAQGGFRWHVSGDIFSYKYAQFIAMVCVLSPKLTHWIYTRSFPYVVPLVNIENLVVNLSADKDNYEEAKKTAEEYGLRMCYMTIDGSLPDDLPSGSVIFPDYSLRATKDMDLNDHEWWGSLSKDYRKMVCPVDMFGKSENVRCGICKKCIRR